MEDATEEVIFEAWLQKLSGVNSKKGFQLTTSWKRRYFVLKRIGEEASLLYYTNKPRTLSDVPKGCLKLAPAYRVEKLPEFKNKPHVCQLMTTARTLTLAAESDRILNLFLFFMQTQRKLRDELEDASFVVRPDNSEDNRKLGARGNMCLLHVSKWGISLAIQLSKCMLCQWPLKSIRSYEITGKGQLTLETGRKSPAGDGKYSFVTRMGQDIAIYEQLDRYVMEAAGLKESLYASKEPHIIRNMEFEMQNIQELSIIQSDPRFSAHLKRISRNIYDQIADHIGGGDLNASATPSVSSEHSPSSSPKKKVASPPMLKPKAHNNLYRSPLPLPQENSEAAKGEANGVSAGDIPMEYLHTRTMPDVDMKQIPSEYLHSRTMPTRDEQQVPSEYLHTRGPMSATNGQSHKWDKKPESPRERNWSGDSAHKIKAWNRDTTKKISPPDYIHSLASSERDSALSQDCKMRNMTPPPSFYEAMSGPSNSPKTALYTSMDKKSMRNRHKSRSCEDLSEYMRISMDALKLLDVDMYAYDNNTFYMNDESKSPIAAERASGAYALIDDSGLSSGEYSYSHIDVQRSFSFQTSKPSAALKRTRSNPFGLDRGEEPLLPRPSFQGAKPKVKPKPNDLLKLTPKSKGVDTVPVVPNGEHPLLESQMSSAMSPTTLKDIHLTEQSKSYKRKPQSQQATEHADYSTQQTSRSSESPLANGFHGESSVA